MYIHWDIMKETKIIYVDKFMMEDIVKINKKRE